MRLRDLGVVQPIERHGVCVVAASLFLASPLRPQSAKPWRISTAVPAQRSGSRSTATGASTGSQGLGWPTRRDGDDAAEGTWKIKTRGCPCRRRQGRVFRQNAGGRLDYRVCLSPETLPKATSSFGPKRGSCKLARYRGLALQRRAHNVPRPQLKLSSASSCRPAAGQDKENSRGDAVARGG